jgi:uncharacterized membrane protein YbhN (UPF0104 family)
MADFRPKVTRKRLIRAGLAAVVVAGLVALGVNLSSQLGGVDDAMGRASLPWLVGALVAEVVCYAALGSMVGRLLGREQVAGRPVAMRLGLVIYGLGSVIPGSPAPGLAMAGAQLKARGMALARLGPALFWCTWFNVRGFLVLAALTGTTATLRGRVPSGSAGVVLGAVLFTVAALTLTTAAVTHPRAGERLGALLARLNWRGAGSSLDEATNRVRDEAIDIVGGRRNQVLLGTFAFVAWVADAICLRFVMVSVGVHIGMGYILIAYVATSLVALVPILPGGLGLVEATVPGVLHHYGVPLDAAIAGTLLWRGISLVLPAAAGGLALATLGARPGGRPVPVRAAESPAEQ